ncbi:helix-turn-helix transcriptional regulator [Nocardia mexicana]|uniref:Helix-turn-helix protein n=1 Tax=Nocardia mexicana TaxID=279262 RepID=A0A370HB24_9NOCA|nr:helix-turn-helix transcriptional regulator [Nocardia mexicana]RDI54118.1 helix-turn-helix protein [Nocardia mexicana]
MDKHAFADFLRRKREHLRPDEAGLSPDPRRRRRTPGLRREEVAWLADISANYYERLEQARAPRPSPQVIAALAEALRLGPDEQRYLTHLAGHELGRPGVPDDEVPPGVLRMLERFTEIPAYVLNARYDVLAWNTLAASLIGDFASERNLLRLAFGTRLAQVSCGGLDGEAQFARQAVAELRAAALRYPDDRRIPELIAWLSTRDEDFQTGWAAHEVAPEPTVWKRFVHPEVGEIELDSQTLSVPGHDQRIVIYTADPGSPAAKSLRELEAMHRAGGVAKSAGAQTF